MFESRVLQNGEVVKFVKFRGEMHNKKDTIISITFDYEKNCARIIVLSGVYVCIERLLYVISADKDFRRILKKYQQGVQENSEQIIEQDGRKDIFITNGSQVKIIRKHDIIRICTVLDFKSVEGQRSSMWIHVNDISKMFEDFQIKESISKRRLMKMAKAEYIGPNCIKDFLKA